MQWKEGSANSYVYILIYFGGNGIVDSATSYHTEDLWFEDLWFDSHSMPS